MTKEGYISRLRLNNARAAARLGLCLLAACVCGTAFETHAVNKPDNGFGRVKSVRFWSHGDITRVAVEVSTKFTFTADHLLAPDRLFFDIRGASPDVGHKGIRSMPVDDALVHQIRIAETQPRVTRVVLDLARNVTVTTSQLTNPNRLIIELRAKDGLGNDGHGKELRGEDPHKGPLDDPELTESDVALYKARAPEAVSDGPQVSSRVTAGHKTVPRKFQAPAHLVQPHIQPRVVDVIEPQVPNPPVLLALGKPARLPYVPSEPMRDLPPPVVQPTVVQPTVVQSTVVPPSGQHSNGALEPGAPTAAKINPGGTSLTRVLGLKLGRIVLDPGHGGNDVGTHGPSGYLEKDLVLDVSHRLAALIEERLGSEVIFTRSDDSYVPLEERTRMANQHKADLFLSIHANSSPYRSATGVETYVLNFTPVRAANELAARENASSSSSVHDLRNLVEQIAAADKADESKEFATRIQYSLTGLPTRNESQHNDGSRNRGIKRAPFVVLIGAAMPSVLAEIGFLSNAEEETLLRKPEYRQKIAEALYKGIASYAETLSRIDVARKN